MVALARWHLAASRYVSLKDAAEWFGRHGSAESPTVAERLSILGSAEEGKVGLIRSCLAAEKEDSIRNLASEILDLYRRGRDRMIADLRGVRSLSVSLQPVLRDVWHDHLLFTGDKVTGLIDPSACRADSVACDLSRLIGSLAGDDVRERGFALEEYERIRPLSSNERVLVQVFDRSGVLLSGWTWLEWLYLERRPFPDVSRVIVRLTEILTRMRRLLDGVSPSNGKLVLPKPFIV